MLRCAYYRTVLHLEIFDECLIKNGHCYGLVKCEILSMSGEAAVVQAQIAVLYLTPLYMGTNLVVAMSSTRG